MPFGLSGFSGLPPRTHTHDSCAGVPAHLPRLPTRPSSCRYCIVVRCPWALPILHSRSRAPLGGGRAASVARTAEGPEVAAIVRATPGQRNDVVNRQILNRQAFIAPWLITSHRNGGTGPFAAVSTLRGRRAEVPRRLAMHHAFARSLHGTVAT